MGETVNLANNLVAGVSMVAVTEAFALDVAKGATPRVLFDMMSKASGNCWTLHARCPASGVLSERPVNDGTRQYAATSRQGYARLDFSAVAKLLQANESMK